MRRLRKRIPVDVARRDERHRRQTWTRWVYLAVVFGVFVWLGDLFFGSLIYFRSDGMVLATRATIATEFPARIREINVREGHTVDAGATVVAVTSQQVAESIARLTSEFATQRSRLSELRVRRQVVASIISLAQLRPSLVPKFNCGSSPSNLTSMTAPSTWVTRPVLFFAMGVAPDYNGIV